MPISGSAHRRHGQLMAHHSLFGVSWRHFIPLLRTTAMFPTFRLFEAISLPFKRAQLGLFQGKTKQYGNNVPFSKKKTRRSWLPNVHNKRLFSDTLQRNIRFKVTARALRTIKKVSKCQYLCSSIRCAHTCYTCSAAAWTSICSRPTQSCLDGRVCVYEWQSRTLRH